MNLLRRFIFFFLIVVSIQCNPSTSKTLEGNDFEMIGKGALLTTRFSSFEEFKSVVQIEYSKDKKSWVKLTHLSNGQKVVSILKSGVSEKDILKTRSGSFLDKVWLSLRTPYFVRNRYDLMRAYLLSRRRHHLFGGADVAFYDLAETMMNNIEEEDLALIPSEDLSEKGFINTFNHVNAQAFMTSLFSEDLADFIADTHERSNMSELVSGNFSEEQLADIKNGPVDNYIDIINNEWGQELGKRLREKYNIQRTTIWTPELLTNYLNDLQQYYSWVFQIGFKPYRPADELITKFSKKINRVMDDVSELM